MKHDALDDSEGVSPWPAFVDLLAASTLLLTVLVAVLIFISNSQVAAERAKGTAEATQRDSLVARLRAGSRGGSLYQVLPDGQLVRVTIAADVTFPKNRWSLEEMAMTGRAAFDSIGAILGAPSVAALVRQVHVVGHTDQARFHEGELSDWTNWELSATRAAVVARYLVERSGLDPCKLIPTGRGPYFPVAGLLGDSIAKNDAAAMRSNRRIELEVMPELVTPVARTTDCYARGDR